MTTRFDSYSEFMDANSSEKLTLAHVSAFARLHNFTLDSGNLYKRVTNHVVTQVKRLDVYLTKVDDAVSVDDETKFYFDINTSTLYLYSTTGDLSSDKVIVNYRLFFSSGPIALAWDLTDTGLPVEYVSRLQRSPSFKSKVGSDQKGISLTGSGSLMLENTDGYFDGLYDTLTFEQKSVEIYSFHRDLLPSQAKLLYRGSIVNKSYSDKNVVFKVKDNFFKLDQRIPLTQYTESDPVSSQFVGQYKRRIYGRQDGLLIRSISQVGNGFALTGTCENLTIGNLTLTGTGTLFLDETSPGDVISINGESYEIESVESDTSLTIGDSDGFQIVFESATITNVPQRPWRKKNRTFTVADHAVRQVTTDLVSHPQLNRVNVVDSEGFEENDVIDVGAETGQVKRVSGNLITTRFNLPSLVSTPATVLKRPVSNVYIEGVVITLDDITLIDNVVGKCEVTLSDVTEFNIALTKSFPSFVNLTFTNGSRSVTTTDDVDLTQYIQPRDWVKTSSAPDTEFYEVLAVSEQEITLRVNFAEGTSTQNAAYRTPELISDDSNVSCDVLGKTKDGTPSGDWIKTGAEVIEDLLLESDLADFIDTSGFVTASENARQLMSIALPRNITSTTLPSIKSVVDDINQSIFGSLVLNNNLDMTYNILDVGLLTQELRTIQEQDAISWNIKSESGKLFKSASAQYRFVDFDNISKTSTGKLAQFTSEFVEDYETSVNTEDLELFVYGDNDAQELTERFVYINSLSESQINITGSLNLADIEMGQKVLLDFDRMYKRLGDSTIRTKVGTVIGVDRSGEQVKLTITDLGNLYNRSCIISDDAAPEFSVSDSEDKIITSYITDENGLTDTDEDTVNTNLIT